METPPSTRSVLPVVKLEESEARYSTERAISSALATRRLCALPDVEPEQV